MEGQNQNYVNEVHALREAQADQEERHTAEVIELKKTQLDVVKQSVEDESKPSDDDHNMLLNLVKVKDEEIKQLKRQLGVAELPENSDPASPLRASQRQKSPIRTQVPTSKPAAEALEDQLIALNQGSLEEQIKSLIKENYDLKMQNAADIERIGDLASEISQLKQPFKLTSQ